LFNNNNDDDDDDEHYWPNATALNYSTCQLSSLLSFGEYG